MKQWWTFFDVLHRIWCCDGKKRNVSIDFFIACALFIHFFFAINFKVIAVVWWNFITPSFGDLYHNKVCNSMSEMNMWMHFGASHALIDPRNTDKQQQLRLQFYNFICHDRLNARRKHHVVLIFLHDYACDGLDC